MTVRLAGAALGGLLLAASLPPRGWWFLALAGVAAIAAALHGARLRHRLAVGAVAGLALYVPALSWMWSFTLLGWLLATALQTVILAAAAAAVAPRAVVVTLPAVLVLAETAKLRWPFGGLAVSALALGQADGPFARAAVLAGPALVLFLVALLGAAIGVRAWRQLAAAVAVTAVTLAGAALIQPVSPTRPVRVAVVQAGGDRHAAGLRSDLDQRFAAHVAAASSIRTPVDLVLLPESIGGVDAPLDQRPELADLGRLARRLDAVVIAGMIEHVDDRRFWNAALALGPDGRIVDRFDKVHRVPFGEYVPLRPLVALLRDDVSNDEEIAGRGPGILSTPLGPLGVAISYEVWFPRRVREAVHNGAGLVLGPTRVDWFPGEVVASQEVATSRLRAIETGRPVLLASHASYSAIVDADGRLLARSRLGERAVLRATVALHEGVTPFVAAGEYPVLAIALVSLGAAATTTTRRRVPAPRPARPAGSPTA